MQEESEEEGRSHLGAYFLPKIRQDFVPPADILPISILFCNYLYLLFFYILRWKEKIEDSRNQCPFNRHKFLISEQ